MSLVEILVALTVLEIGLLGVVGLMVSASRILSRAAALERAVTLAGAVADSLAITPVPGEGEREVDGLRIRWEADPEGVAVLVEPLLGGEPVLELLLPRRDEP